MMAHSRPIANIALVLIAAAVICVETSRGLAAQFVELEAAVEVLQWSPARPPNDLYPGGVPAILEKRTFTTHCVVGTNMWLMENAFDEATTWWWFTGTNLIHRSKRTKLPTKHPEMFARNHPESIHMLGQTQTRTLRIADGSLYGRRDDGSIHYSPMDELPWLAFCSGSFLKREGRRIPLPIYFNIMPAERAEFVDQTAVFPDALGLPISVDLTSTNRSMQARYRIASPPHDFTGGTTNVLGWSFALEFHFVITAPGPNLPSVTHTAVGKITHIREADHAPQLLEEQ